MMNARYIRDIEVTGFQKRRHPSKYYEYIIKVVWSDRSVVTVFRRYSQFFSLQCKLLDKFPVEGGEINPADRFIPFLPGKIFFGRSHTREVAAKRKDPIAQYCTKLIALPERISRCDYILDFFHPCDTDNTPAPFEDDNSSQDSNNNSQLSISEPIAPEVYRAVADYKGNGRGEISLTAGQHVMVREKLQTGWWFVSAGDYLGWVPGCYLEAQMTRDEPQLPSEGLRESYIAQSEYRAQHRDEISFETGAVLTVVTKNLDGWWRVRYRGKEGFAPAVYLRKTETGFRESTKFPDARRYSIVYEDVDIYGTFTVPPRRSSVKRPVGPPKPPPPQCKHYSVVAAWTDDHGDSLNLSPGDVVQVMQRSDTGWWYVSLGDRSGWVPRTYLRPCPSQRRTLGASSPSSSASPSPETLPRSLVASGKHQGLRLMGNGCYFRENPVGKDEEKELTGGNRFPPKSSPRFDKKDQPRLDVKPKYLKKDDVTPAALKTTQQSRVHSCVNAYDTASCSISSAPLSCSSQVNTGKQKLGISSAPLVDGDSSVIPVEPPGLFADVTGNPSGEKPFPQKNKSSDDVFQRAPWTKHSKIPASIAVSPGSRDTSQKISRPIKPPLPVKKPGLAAKVQKAKEEAEGMRPGNTVPGSNRPVISRKYGAVSSTFEPAAKPVTVDGKAKLKQKLESSPESKTYGTKSENTDSEKDLVTSSFSIQDRIRLFQK